MIHERICALIHRHQPSVLVLEKIFTHHHYLTTAAKMGHARGAACLAAQQYRIPVAEYAPTDVKKSLTGSGRASKEQVARMVSQWIHTTDPAWSMDATDALALAIAHAHVEHRRQTLPGALVS